MTIGESYSNTLKSIFQNETNAANASDESVCRTSESQEEAPEASMQEESSESSSELHTEETTEEPGISFVLESGTEEQEESNPNTRNNGINFLGFCIVFFFYQIIQTRSKNQYANDQRNN